ncbi:Uncharacterised protein [Klebsiella pneumoniae]|uniref:Uncharacterized protein n=1 Tax=Klebsiella pneumoniae TaxID=573 RepID=A0A377TKH2_KLEPN|nr:Uncharacterised protein [Klebsiella pneumoniae]
MSLTKEDLVFDLYYASSTDEEGNKLAQLTVQFRDASAVPHVTTQLARTTLKRDRSKVYAVGEQSVKNGSDTLLAAIEAYYRTDPKTIFENLMAQVQDMIEATWAPTIPGLVHTASPLCLAALWKIICRSPSTTSSKPANGA